MSKPVNGDRVTNRQLYEELGKLRKHLYVVILAAMGLNQYLAAVGSQGETRIESYVFSILGLF